MQSVYPSATSNDIIAMNPMITPKEDSRPLPLLRKGGEKREEDKERRRREEGTGCQCSKARGRDWRRGKGERGLKERNEKETEREGGANRSDREGGREEEERKEIELEREGNKKGKG